MYSLMRQPHRPTAIEHCVACKFVSKSEENLVVAGTTQLNVFAIRETKDDVQKQKTRKGSTAVSGDKLELLLQCTLHGVISELQSVQLGSGGRDALLIAFDDGKISLVEYDPASHDLLTVAILNAELDDLQGGMHMPTMRPMLRIDPEHRCAVLLVYDRYLIVCPFRRDDPTANRSGILPHYHVALHSLDTKLHNVLDMQFLHGYYEPTVFVLFEPTRTCPGRVAARQDTVSLLAISLSLMERVHPVIWSFDGLPCDSYKALAVPKPIGGAVVLAVNSLLYLNQSVPPYGVSVNSIAARSSHFPLHPQDGVTFSMDCAQACFISSDRFVVSLRSGEIYVVGLKADNMRMVRGFQFDHAAASVLTSCVCTLSDKHLFLGSRLGNSLLVRYTKREVSDVQARTAAQLEPAAKRRSAASDWLAGLDADELEVYGSALDSDPSAITYAFQVCDSVLNIGPLTSSSLGTPSFLSDEFHSDDKRDLELVSCSGHGKNGCLSVVQQTIRPQVVTTFELQGCLDMWTVLAGKPSTSHPTSRSSTHDASTDGRHSFLILSRKDRTMILRTGVEISELDQYSFDAQSPTVFAGNIGKNNYILQVCPQGVRLLEGETEVQYEPLVAETHFTRCSLVSPHAILQCDDGTMYILTLHETGATATIRVEPAPLTDASAISACCLYKDVGKLFNTGVLSTDPAAADIRYQRKSSVSIEIKAEVVPGVAPVSGLTAEEEDELLYGGSTTAAATTPSKPATTAVPEEDDVDLMLYADDVTPTSAKSKGAASDNTNSAETFWCVICRESGCLEIFLFPEMVCVFTVRNFSTAPRVLVDDVGQDNRTSSEQPVEVAPVLEVLAVGLGPTRSKPHLLVRSADDLQIYEAFQYPSSVPGERLNVRFKKVQHNIILRGETFSGAAAAQNGGSLEDEKTQFVPMLRYFNNISSHNGVFLCGSSAHWLFMTQRGALRSHPMMVDGYVSSFAPFDNVNCPQGFLYFNGKSELRIAALPRNVVFDADWLVRKVPLRCTPHYVSYHPDFKIYGVVCSHLSPRKVEPHTVNDDTATMGPVDEGGRFVYPELRTYSLEIFSPTTWESAPNARVEYDQFEMVVTMQVVRLQSEQTVSGTKCYFAVCTCTDMGEEVASKSTIKIYDVTDVVPEPGKPLSNYKLKTMYDKEMKGSVSAIGSVQGYMIGAVCQKIYIWSFMGGKDLMGVAFVDTNLFIHTITSIKNFILLGDLERSISVLRFDKARTSLSIVSRDTHHLDVVAVNFMVDNKKLGFVASDMRNNLLVYGYHPESLESQGGKLLLRRADVHVGTRVNTVWRTAVQPASLDSRTGLGLVVRKDRRHVTWFSGMDGSVGYLIPVAEKTYRRLLRLQDKLATFLPHCAALHPKAFRAIRTERPLLVNPHRNILDGELLVKYLHISKTEQLELAKSLGTTPSLILNDLLDVNYSTCVY